jgi:hypothetical protein
VTALEQGPGFKNRSATYLHGEYKTGGDLYQFSVEWALSDIEDHVWVPPSGTPPVGSTILLQADPSTPSRVALEKAPAVPSIAWEVFQLLLIVGSFVGGAIVVWFM